MKRANDDRTAFADAVGICASYLDAWKHLPERIAGFLDATEVLVKKPRKKEHANAVEANARIVASLREYYKKGIIDTAILTQRNFLVRELVENYKGMDDVARNVANRGHDLTNCLVLLAPPPSLSMSALEQSGAHADELRSAYSAMEKGDVVALEPLFERLDGYRAELATSKATASRALTSRPGRWRVFIVEDDELWRAIYQRAVEAACDRLGAEGLLDVEHVDTTDPESAKKMVAVLKEQYEKTTAAIKTQRADQNQGNAIVVLNLGLPGPRGGGDIHARGLEILNAIRKSASHAFVIVVTAPHNSIEHHIQAYQLAAAYIVKGSDTEQRLRDKICDLMTRQLEWEIHLVDDGTRRVRLKHGRNTAELLLPQPQMFDVLAAVVGCKRQEGISESWLVERIREARKKRETGTVDGPVDVADAVSRLWKELRTQWESITGEPCCPEIDILRKFYKIDYPDPYYRLAAKLVDLNALEGDPQVDGRAILVVEDQLEIASAIVQALEGRQYRTLRADAVARAIELTRVHQPWLVILDMHLPMNSGDKQVEFDGALKFLDGLEPSQREVLAKIVFSRAINDDIIRAPAESLGLRPGDFIPKFNPESLAFDTAALVIKVWQKEKEAKRMALISDPNLPYIPWIRLPDEPENLLPEELMDCLEVDGRLIPPKSEPAAQLLLVLLQGRTELVPPGPLLDLYLDLDNDSDDSPGVPGMRLTSAIRSLREHIERAWLGHLAKEERPPAAKAVLKTVGKEGYQLIVRLIIDPRPRHQPG